ADFHDGDRDIAVNHDAFIFFPGQDKHGCVSFPGSEVPRLDAVSSQQVLRTPESPSRRALAPPDGSCSVSLDSSAVSVALSAQRVRTPNAPNLLTFKLTVPIIPVKDLRQKLPSLTLISVHCLIALI